MITKEQILAMPAGRELDRTVALTVMGYEPSKMYADLVLKGAKAEYPKPYSTDISAAWEVVEKLAENYDDVAVYKANDGWGCTIAEFLPPNDEFEYNSSVYECAAPTAPEVICKAALLAVMGL